MMKTVIVYSGKGGVGKTTTFTPASSKIADKSMRKKESRSKFTKTGSVLTSSSLLPQAIKPENCPNHRTVLISSEEIYDNKWHFGTPIANKCVFKCFACNNYREYTFKTK